MEVRRDSGCGGDAGVGLKPSTFYRRVREYEGSTDKKHSVIGKRYILGYENVI